MAKTTAETDTIFSANARKTKFFPCGFCRLFGLKKFDHMPCRVHISLKSYSSTLSCELCWGSPLTLFMNPSEGRPSTGIKITFAALALDVNTLPKAK